jgi:hypothetical protein
LDVENSVRGILRGFGLKVGHTTNRSFAGRVEDLVVSRARLKRFSVLWRRPASSSSTATSRVSGSNKRGRAD